MCHCVCVTVFVLVVRVVGLWRESLSKKNAKAAQSLADPTEYENLFPGLTDAFKTEQFLATHRHQVIPAAKFSSIQVCIIMLLFMFVKSPFVTYAELGAM